MTFWKHWSRASHVMWSQVFLHENIYELDAKKYASCSFSILAKDQCHDQIWSANPIPPARLRSAIRRTDLVRAECLSNKRTLALWIKTLQKQKIQFLGDKQLFARTLGVHQGYRLLTANLSLLDARLRNPKWFRTFLDGHPSRIVEDVEVSWEYHRFQSSNDPVLDDLGDPRVSRF